MDPRAKLLTTAVFLVCVVSFGKYEVAPMLPFALYPVALATVGRVPLGYVARKILLVAPFAALVGALNPVLDREVLMHLGGLSVTGGWISFASILVRSVLTIGAAIVLIAVTSFDGLCLALQRLGVPRVFTVQLLFLYRYLFVLADEALRLMRARSLRSFRGRGMGMGVYTGMVGRLLLRTLDRARRIHTAMSCRGFNGELHLTRTLRFGVRDLTFVAGWCGFLVCCRVWDVTRFLGAFVTGTGL